jgi:membrane protease YdiL (CAAX protease family)
LFLPLSYVAPGVVSWWLLEAEPPDFIGGFSLDAILVNSTKAFTIALLVPIVEEIVFRGFILHRWCEKYGEKRGIVQASILFSMLHAELLGNFVGSVIMSVLCLRTKSLVGPILIHIGNNFVVVFVILCVWFMGGDVEGFSGASTIEEFRSGWWYGAIGAVISVPWLYWFVKTRLLHSNDSP